MIPDIKRLTNLYRTKGVFVDANLLILFFIGYVDRNYIPKFKRTSTYLPEDFDTLNTYLDNFSNHFTTPNVLTEVSNLANALKGEYRDTFAYQFAKGINILNEEYIVSSTLAGTQTFSKFGLTDSGIISLVKGKYLLLTDDLKLAHYFSSVGGDVVNFNHLRIRNWE